MANVYIVAAKRTPFGAFMGKLSGLTASELGLLLINTVDLPLLLQ